MKYSKNDIIDVATKLGRLVNGGVVGYYAGGKTSEVMRKSIPNELVNVVERYKKFKLGASLAQIFIGEVASSAAVASLWKMYYDINNVLGIKISENAGKILAAAVITNLTSAGAQAGATVASESAKSIPFVGPIASVAINTVTSTAIVYGTAYLYLTALTKMYEAEGKFDLNYLTSSLEGEDYSSEWDEEEDEELENDRDEEDAQSRFSAFFNSYINGDYNDWKYTKLAGLFEREAEECQYDVIKSQYYCVAAVVRLEFFLKEWFNNSFKNYPTVDRQKGLFQECLVKGQKNILKSRDLLPDDMEYLIISASLAMLKDFWLDDSFDDSKEQKDFFVDLYGGVVEECKNFDNSMFNMEWLVEMFTKSYNAIMSILESSNNRTSNESSYNEAEQEYLDNIREFLEDDAEITPRERKMLDRIRQKLGISEERAKELEASLSKPKLTEDESIDRGRTGVS